VGFYKQPFFACKNPCPNTPAAGLGARQSLAMEKVKVEPGRVQQFEKISVSATLAAMDENLSGASQCSTTATRGGAARPSTPS